MQTHSQLPLVANEGFRVILWSEKTPDFKLGRFKLSDLDEEQLIGDFGKIQVWSKF